MKTPVHFSAKTDQWTTPPWLLETVYQFFRPDRVHLDPCADADMTVEAYRHFIGGQRDGLQESWANPGGYPANVYMNPPYGRAIALWMDKLEDELRLKHVDEALVLLPARTDTKWGQQALGYDICFLAGRLRFGSATSSAPFPSMLIHVGLNSQRFLTTFETLGVVLRGWSPYPARRQPIRFVERPAHYAKF